MRDGISKIIVKQAISPQAAVTDTTPFVSSIIDVQGFDEASFLILTGSLADADATFAVLVDEGDASDLSDAAAVADDDLVSQTIGTAPETAAAFTFAHDNQVRKIGYVGTKRYIRLTVTPAANTGNAFVAAVALLGRPAPGNAALAQPTA